MLVLQLLSVFGYGIMAYQDIRDREVSWVLFPLLGICLALSYGLQVGISVFTFSVMVNLILITCVVLLLWGITKFILKKPFLDVSFGLGDMLFLYVFALGFPTMTFVFLLVGSLLFSLAAFFLMKFLLQTKTVPLAGLMGLFLMAFILLALIPGTPSLYAY
ncbi:hypothetical protein [Allomuricauda sp. F6463D]|uniref:hypothetical protein n=1 Tax=Allomuricauda sp. F6463D TaxID=2926409 RepID=UPI001FF280A5|nr:hypothetical protein [Muricauda sp. F6463D]MCK0160139.1 hypothetical protein [Muricauda sp. F6463D]